MGMTPKHARILADLSQKEVAEKLKVHRQTYMKWEQNPDEMPIGKAKRFSNIVGRGIEEIFFDSKSTLSRQSTNDETCATIETA